MTQPSFVPIPERSQVRPALRLEPPRPWQQGRPGDIRFPARPGGPRFGSPGPDQGYALWISRKFAGQLRLGAGEHQEDVLVGCALLASRRAALLGRAPTVHDIRTALALWGLLDEGAPEGLVALRRSVFSALCHDNAAQQSLVDRVPTHALLLSADQVADKVGAGEWSELVGGD